MSRRTLGIFGLLAGGAALAWWRSRAAGENPIPMFADLQVGGDVHQLVDAPGYADPGYLVQAGLQAHGIDATVARGATAGAWAESRLDPNARNPTSGAYGIGQWLGSRKAELFRRYGSRPSLGQQIEFLAWELQGGDHGGKAVLAQTTAAGALDVFIRRFERPAAGAETAGDLARGLRYLG